MSIYFFHVTEGDDIVPAAEGIERADLAAAEKIAVDAAGDLIAEAVKRGERDCKGRIDVEDERGANVMKLTFACPVQTEIISLRPN